MTVDQKALAFGRRSDGLLVPLAVDENGKIVLSSSEPQEFETLIVGDFPTNYFEVENDGTFELHGEATTWRDELGLLLGSRLESPSSDIVQNLPESTITFKDSARYPTDYITYTLQLNHDWLVGSDVEFHIHWLQASSANVNWLLEYRWQINGQTKTSAWTQAPLTDQIFTYSSGTLVQINEIENMITPPSNAYLSDFFQVRLYRDYTNASGLFASAETGGLDVDAISADMHRKSNTLGSREEYVK